MLCQQSVYRHKLGMARTLHRRQHPAARGSTWHMCAAACQQGPLRPGVCGPSGGSQVLVPGAGGALTLRAPFVLLLPAATTAPPRAITQPTGTSCSCIASVACRQARQPIGQAAATRHSRRLPAAAPQRTQRALPHLVQSFPHEPAVHIGPLLLLRSLQGWRHVGNPLCSAF